MLRRMEPLDVRADAPRPSAGRGYTLIEVLVVVAVIALLIAILMPALANAREQARAVKCLTNLRQFGQATMMYTGANKSSLPGPTHQYLYLNTEELFRPHSEYWFRQTPGYYLRRYLDKSPGLETYDQVATCPTRERLDVPAPAPGGAVVSPGVLSLPAQLHRRPGNRYGRDSPSVVQHRSRLLLRGPVPRRAAVRPAQEYRPGHPDRRGMDDGRRLVGVRQYRRLLWRR